MPASPPASAPPELDRHGRVGSALWHPLRQKRRTKCPSGLPIRHDSDFGVTLYQGSGALLPSAGIAPSMTEAASVRATTLSGPRIGWEGKAFAGQVIARI